MFFLKKSFLFQSISLSTSRFNCKTFHYYHTYHYQTLIFNSIPSFQKSLFFESGCFDKSMIENAEKSVEVQFGKKSKMALKKRTKRKTGRDIKVRYRHK